MNEAIDPGELWMKLKYRGNRSIPDRPQIVFTLEELEYLADLIAAHAADDPRFQGD